MVGSANCCTLFDDRIRSTKVVVHILPGQGPAIGFTGFLVLVDEVVENLGSILLNALNIAEEDITLILEDPRGQKAGRRTVGSRRVQGIEHREAIGFVEGDKRHFVDESLYQIVSSCI